jgi:hypothetical protein
MVLESEVYTSRNTCSPFRPKELAIRCNAESAIASWCVSLLHPVRSPSSDDEGASSRDSPISASSELTRESSSSNSRVICQRLVRWLRHTNFGSTPALIPLLIPGEIINFQIVLSGHVLLTATRAVWIADDFAFQIALSHQVLCVSPWYIVSRVLEQVYRKIAQSCALACHEIVVQSSHRHNDKDSFDETQKKPIEEDKRTEMMFSLSIFEWMFFRP